MKSENFEMALDEIIWLITLLANQSVLIYNLKNREIRKDELKEEEVEVFIQLIYYGTVMADAFCIPPRFMRMS